MAALRDTAGRFLRRNSRPPTPDTAVRTITAAELAEQMLAEEYGEEAPPAPSSYSLAILRGMQGRAIYTGTVPAHVTAKRRAKNKAARKTRRLSRLRGQ